MRRRILAFLGAAALLACSDLATPPRSLLTPTPLTTISDGSHGSGNAHFYFLPPMVSSPATSGTFDPNVSPTVDICTLAGTACAGAPFATFTTTTGPGSETVRVDSTSDLYIVNWHTDQFPLASGATYRVSVSVSGNTVGFADVAVITNAGQAKNVATGENIPLVDGKTLPIKFRIEQGMVVAIAVNPNPASVIVGKTVALSATVTDAHGNIVTDQPVMWSSNSAAVASVDASGTVTGVSVGSTTLSASSNAVFGSAQVMVIQPPVASVVVSPASSTITAGQTVQLSATLRDADGNVLTGRPVSWTSSNSALAAVDGNGLVSSTQPGGVSITASAEGVTGVASVSVNPAGFVAAVGSVAPGQYQTCGLTPSGSAYCWGANDKGQLGTGATGGWAPRPQAVAGGFQFAQITAGSQVTCALTADGTAYCWGFNGQGSLGDGTFVDHPAPAPVLTSVRFKQLSAGGNSTCGLALDGSAWCWGSNASGLLNAGVNDQQPQPVPVLGGLTYVSISNGVNNTCALTAAGDAFCWGFGGYRANGGGSPVLGGHTFSSVTVGMENACALDTTGAAWCWGTNEFGQFGNGIASGAGDPNPVPAGGGLTFTQLRASWDHTCGLTSGGNVYCWGSNDGGQLGDGTNVTRLSPVLVATSLKFVSLAAGNRDHTCATTASAAVYCWGDNGLGELGDGTNTSRNAPVQVVTP